MSKEDNSVFYLNIFDEIRSTVSLVKEMESHGIKFVSGGRGRLKCCCPFPDHKDGTPSCFVWTNNDPESFYCFGCKKSGSVIDFTMYYGENGQDQLTLRSSIEYLIKKHDIKSDRFDIEKIKNIPDKYKKNEPPFFSKTLLISEDIRDFISQSIDLDRDFKEISHYTRNIDLSLFNRDYQSIGVYEEIISKALKSVRKKDLIFGLKKECLNCHLCDLRLGCKKPIFGNGNYSAKILILWDSPHEFENKQDKLIDYGIGKILQDKIVKNKIDISLFWFATCICCSSKRNPKTEEVNMCIKSYLSKVLNCIDIKSIIIIGEKTKDFLLPNMIEEEYNSMCWSKRSVTLFGKSYSVAFLPETSRIFNKSQAQNLLEPKFVALLNEAVISLS